jgi:hypothetical protein
MLEAVADPKDERHKEFKEWARPVGPRSVLGRAREAQVRAWFAPRLAARGRKGRGKPGH